MLLAVVAASLMLAVPPVDDAPPPNSLDEIMQAHIGDLKAWLHEHWEPGYRITPPLRVWKPALSINLSENLIAWSVCWARFHMPWCIAVTQRPAPPAS